MFIVSIVPINLRPSIHVSKIILPVVISGIIIFSFLPVLQIIQVLSPRMGLIQSFQAVLLTYELGKSWMVTVFASTILLIFVILYDIGEKKRYGYAGAFIMFLVILSLGWSSHAGSIDRLWGFLNDTMHLLAVSVWVGTLYVVSWFSKDSAKWLAFLKWFSPLAICCFFITMLTGFVLMSFMVEFRDYPNSWMIPYGQFLLLKHIFIIPLIIYAFINSIFVRKKLKNEVSFDPKPWAKVESIIILLIFAITASIGQQSPPRETEISSESVSSLFTSIYQGEFHPSMSIHLYANPNSILFLLLAILFLALITFSFLRRVPAIVSFYISLCLVASIYIAIMFSVE
nr:CopD family protein [Lysinibacillus timonensis]